MCEALAQRFHGLLAPPMRYGQHSSTKNMPGTISLSFDTLRSLIRDILNSLADNGIKKMVVISGHAGSAHMIGLKLGAEEVVLKRGVRVMLLTDYDIAYHFPLEIEGDGHGGLIETSRMMALVPKLVKQARKVGEFIDPQFMVLPNPEANYPDGFVGNAPKATVELGREVNEFILDRLTKMIGRNFGEERSTTPP
jgi:creatinine amidohydrolase